jgi:hypothetical protein
MDGFFEIIRHQAASVPLSETKKAESPLEWL